MPLHMDVLRSLSGVRAFSGHSLSFASRLHRYGARRQLGRGLLGGVQGGQETVLQPTINLLAGRSEGRPRVLL